MNNVIPITVINDRISLDIVPFTDCNLNCEFCETVKNRVKFDSDRFNQYYNYIVKLITKNHYKHLYFHLQGGELFMDKLTDQQIDIIKRFILDVRRLCYDNNIDVECCIISNLITRNIERVYRFLNDINHNIIITSFDLDGRFTKQFQIDLWFKNVQYLKNKGIDVVAATILTESAFKLIQNRVKPWIDYFETIYNNYNYFVSQYNNLTNVSRFTTTPQRHSEMVKWLYDRYPKLFKGYVNCLNKHQIASDQRCNKTSIEMINDWIHPVCLQCSNFEYGMKLFEKRQCISCQWLGTCRMHCNDQLPLDEYCIDRDILDYISKHESPNNSNL